jgi:hypothetical protein
MFRPWENVQPDNNGEEIQIEDEEPLEEEMNRKRKHLSSDAKDIVKNVYQSLLEKDCSAPIKVTSDLVKLPYSTVQDIIADKEKKVRSYKKYSRISEELGTEIKQDIYNMYKQNVVPTTSNLLVKLRELGYEVNYREESFRLYLRSVGYQYKLLNQRITIMETPRLKKWRWEYITQIRKYRQECRYVVYLDETWYDTHDMVKRGISDGTNNCCLKSVPSKGKRIIILHAGGTDGWASNALLLSAKNIQNCSADYHSDMNSTLFETWFQQQLIPHLPPNSVIVMDSASYHSKLVYKKPSKATKKQEIIDFMITNNINIPDGKITKDTLFIFSSNYIFKGLAFETLGPWCKETIDFINVIGDRLIAESGDSKSKKFLFERISLAIQRGNAASIRGTFPDSALLSEIFAL